MMKATLAYRDLSQKIGEAVSMVMSSIMERMEKALKDDGARTSAAMVVGKNFDVEIFTQCQI